MTKEVYFILPKLSSYEYKDIEVKQSIEKLVKEWYERILSWDKRVCCFVEDWLALALLGERDVKWYTLLSDADKNFIKTSMEDYPKTYLRLPAINVKDSIIKSTVKKYKNIKPMAYSSSEEFRIARATLLLKRIRYASMSVMESEKVIVYINGNNNYCTAPKPEVGDGRMIIEVELSTGRAMYTYGGLPLNKENFELVIRSV